MSGGHLYLAGGLGESCVGGNEQSGASNHVDQGKWGGVGALSNKPGSNAVSGEEVVFWRGGPVFERQQQLGKISELGQSFRLVFVFIL